MMLDKRLEIRLTEDEKDNIIYMAELSKLSVNAFVRKCLTKCLEDTYDEFVRNGKIK